MLIGVVSISPSRIKNLKKDLSVDIFLLMDLAVRLSSFSLASQVLTTAAEISCRDGESKCVTRKSRNCSRSFS